MSFTHTTEEVRSVSKQGHFQPHCHGKGQVPDQTTVKLYDLTFETNKFKWTVDGLVTISSALM